MCVKIVTASSVVEYNSDLPLEEQLHNSQQVVINYEPFDSDITKFVREVERMCRTGIGTSVKVEVKHNNHMRGIKTKKQLNKLMRTIEINEAIKMMVNMQSKLEKDLEDLVSFCRNCKIV